MVECFRIGTDNLRRTAYTTIQLCGVHTCESGRAETNVTAFSLHARAIRLARIRVAQVDFSITQVLGMHAYKHTRRLTIQYERYRPSITHSTMLYVV